MNSYALKIVGSFELSEPIDTTKDILVQIPATPYSAEKLDQQNGDFLIRYKAKVSGEAIITSGERQLVAKDPRKASQKLRLAIEAKGRSLGLDTEVYYQSEITKLIYSYAQHNTD